MTWPDRYLPKEVEQRLYRFWEEQKCFSPKLKTSSKKFFSILLPPPNVTGALHLGHALNHTIQDCMIRWKKMQGFQTAWLPGTDHAGIATQIQVEKQIAKKGQTKESLGRELFLKKVWEWKKKYGSDILNQMKRLGSACDWEQHLFTLDPSSKRAVKKAFVHFYNKGLIYRGPRLVNWSVGLSSAISDLEVEHREVDSHLWKIRYPFIDAESPGKKFLTVATTRPETLLADQALCVHPKDSRWKKYQGKKVLLPLMKRPLPILTDPYVDPEFGTGVLKITPAHDFNDYKIGKKHNLKELNILNKDGKFNSNAGPYEGLSVLEAREKIVQDLKKENLLEEIKPYRHSKAFCSRSGSAVEPFLSDQWFLKMEGLAERGLESALKKEVELIPGSWIKTFSHWMKNLDDWCLSRQLWWGHPIPAAECLSCSEITVSEKEIKKCGHCGSSEIKKEQDVLDTWFSSALWPMSILKWPDQNVKGHSFFPTSVLVTAPDILFFWVARMIMMSLEFQNEVPFKTVYLHGVVRDDKGRKMSKSLGNGEDPIDLIEESGADALRLALLSSHARGKDVRFSRENLRASRNFLNKIWNAGRFIDSMASKQKLKKPAELNPIDSWVLSELKKTELEVSKHLESFRFASACMSVYHFSWKIFCDWHLEWTKPILKGDSDAQKQSSSYTCVFVFNRLIRLLHPFIPFITEEIAQKSQPQKKQSLLFEDYPEGSSIPEDLTHSKKQKEIPLMMEIISSLRHLRGENNIKPSQKISALVLSQKPEELQKKAAPHQAALLTLAKLKDLKFQKTLAEAQAVMTLPSHPEIKIAILDFLDKKSEKERLNKHILKFKKELSHLDNQLKNKNFIERAPSQIVKEKKERKIKIENKIKNLSADLGRL